MKKFTSVFENYTEANVGNELFKTSVTNHYTPVQNILTNINNLFCCRLSISATVAEDGVSIKLTSSKFTSETNIKNILYMPLYGGVEYSQTSLAPYIMSQGLDKMTTVNLGSGYYVVYFGPRDIITSEQPEDCKCECPGDCECCPCATEMKESLLNEFEISTILNEDNDEEELKSETLEKVLTLLDGTDKVKAAKQLELLISNEIKLPREFYFAAIKFKSGEEAIALRWKYTKNMPFGKPDDGKAGHYKDTTIENTRSVMHIFGKGEKAIWVQDFAKESLITLPDEVKKLIDSILEILEAERTNDPSVYSLTDSKNDDKKDKDDKDDSKEDDKKEKLDDKESKDDKKSDDESEDDNSRGDNSDDLLG